MLNRSEGKSDTIHLRIEPHTKDLIDRAAEVMGRTRSSFMVEAASAQAERVLLDQTIFKLNDEDWNAFNKALDTSPTENKKLRKLLAHRAPWEKH